MVTVVAGRRRPSRGGTTIRGGVYPLAVLVIVTCSSRSISLNIISDA